jgi:hypothetical protein
MDDQIALITAALKHYETKMKASAKYCEKKREELRQAGQLRPRGRPRKVKDVSPEPNCCSREVVEKSV